MSNIILGGGISGLVALHYKNDSVLYERNSSVATDLIDDTFPKYIHFNYDTNMFCSDIGVTPKIQKFNIGVYFRRQMYDFFAPVLTREEQMSLYSTYCMKKYGKVEEDKMNGFISGRREECFIVNKNDIVHKLSKLYKDKIKLNSKVSKIDLKKKLVTINGSEVEYEKLISTLPVNIFCDIANVQCPIKYLTLKCIIFETTDKTNELSKYDFIYVVDEHLRFSRINVSNDKMRYVFEFPTTFVDENDCMQFASEFGLKLFAWKEKGYAFPRVDTPLNLPDVRFVGRFAVGDYTLKTEDVIKELRLG